MHSLIHSLPVVFCSFQSDVLGVQPYLSSTANAVHGGSMLAMPSMQLIQTGPNQFIQQQCMPQQFMFQNMAIPYQGVFLLNFCLEPLNCFRFYLSSLCFLYYILYSW